MKSKKARLIETCEKRIPFNRFLGVRVKKLRRGNVVLVLPFRKEFIGDPWRPAVHGGVISTLMDTAGGAAAWTELEKGDRLSTVDLLVDFLRPAGATDLEAEATLIRVGNRVAVVEITARPKGSKEILAKGRAVYNVVRLNQRRRKE